jgi:large subunit ribosomal protein L37e
MPHSKQAYKKQIQKTHTGCRRCGRTSFHIQKKVCSGCGYPAARNRHYNWGKKMIRRKNRGTGRMRYEKELPRRFKNGFREKVRQLWPSLLTHLRIRCMGTPCHAAFSSACSYTPFRLVPQTQAPAKAKSS